MNELNQKSTKQKIKEILKKVPLLRPLVIFLRRIKNSIKSYALYKKQLSNAKKGNLYCPERIPIIEAPIVLEDETILFKTKDVKHTNQKIAVHLHMFYLDLYQEMLGYINNIPFSFDLFISVPESMDAISDIEKIAKKLTNVSSVVVKKVKNRGRDLAPLYVGFAKEISEYDMILHIHTKKSLYSGQERMAWRQYALNSLLGSEEIVRKIFRIFEENPDTGILYPDFSEDTPAEAYAWLANEGWGRRLCKMLSIPFEEGAISYPVGSFFWIRKEAIKKIYDLHLTLEDFEEEDGQNDGTLAHALERIHGVMMTPLGYQSAIMDYREGVIRWNRSIKPFREKLQWDTKTLLAKTEPYDTVSFDIFDTLITRALYKPDDLFTIIEKKISSFGITCNFLSVRKTAEQNVNMKKGAKTDIHAIYEQMAVDTGWEKDIIEKIKTLEIELEVTISYPRRDMVALFDALKKTGKKIVLVSDMYLTSLEIKRLLNKCGIVGYDDLWVSCENGLRKDGGNVWPVFWDTYPKETHIHIGDNARSDWQTICDMGGHALWILNPRDTWKLSKDYSLFPMQREFTLAESLIMGMAINVGLFNSSISVQNDKKIEVRDIYDIGYGVLGLLFTIYIQWLHDHTKDDEILAFLSREGHVFGEIYNILEKNLLWNPRERYYFLTSRRTASVASLQNKEDAMEILSRGYYGSIANLFYSRLGVEVKRDSKEKDIYTEFIEKNKTLQTKLREIIDEVWSDIEARAKEEKENYLSYIYGLVPKERIDKLVFIDIGYAGTIQYYLSKLLDIKTKGRYMAIANTNSPKTIGCEAIALFDQTDFSNGLVVYKSGFLESALKIKTGQLVNFLVEDGKIVPNYKPDEYIKKDILALQDIIYDVANTISVCMENTDIKLYENTKLFETVFDYYYQGIYFSKELIGLFELEDAYCQDGTIRFSKKKNGWERVEKR